MSYIKANKFQYDNGEYISADKLITLALNKYNILTKFKKWNSMSLEIEQIFALTSVTKILNYYNLTLIDTIKYLFKSARRTRTRQAVTTSLQINEDHRMVSKKSPMTYGKISLHIIARPSPRLSTARPNIGAQHTKYGQSIIYIIVNEGKSKNTNSQRGNNDEAIPLPIPSPLSSM